MDVLIPVSAKRWTSILSVVVMMLVAASVCASFLSFLPVQDPFLQQVRGSLVRLAWVDGEGNIPTWYSASALLLCSFVLAVIAIAHRQSGIRYGAHWAGLALIFAFLSMDETVQIHELAITPLRDAFHTTGYFYYGWVIPAAVCVLLFVLAYLKFLVNLPTRTRWLFLISGAIYVVGALGLEALSGKQASLHGEQTPLYHAIVTFEELFEMMGVVLFIYALLDYLSRQFPTVSFRFARGE
jgi:hypothetical protein